MGVAKWLYSATYGFSTDQPLKPVASKNLEICHVYVTSQDAQKSLLEPYSKPNRKSAILIKSVKIGQKQRFFEFVNVVLNLIRLTSKLCN